MFDLDIKDFQQLQDELMKELGALKSEKVATIGIHEEAGDVESSDLTMAGLGALLNFGGDIKHPGGTSYGYATKAAADRDEVRFLKTGSGYMQIGVTQPHTITIPAREWLEPGVISATPEILATIEAGMAEGKSVDQVLEQVAAVAAGSVKVYMTELKTPPNAASTVRKKGSSNPLIDNGALRQSVTGQVSGDKVTEGIE